MKVKEELLELFETNKGEYFSGEEIARKLCVSRAAIWKAVKLLREEGYEIDAVTNKGYSLSVKTDILSAQGIQKYLNSEYRDLNIAVLPTINSTNAFVREKANSSQPEGYVLIANEQTEGRGRQGRSFFSPYGTGIYLSLLLRPDHYLAHQATQITTMAAVAISEAIEEVSEEKAQIKWVNDIYVRGKKVCGILTEASLSLESGLVEYIVLGVGLNVYMPQNGFPGEIQKTAGALFNTRKDDMKNHLVAVCLNHFMDYYRNKGQTSFIDKYRSRSMAIGRQITILSGNQTQHAFAYGVDEDCRLLVRYEDGKEERLISGEISIRI